MIVLVFLGFSLPPYFTGGTRVPATFALHYPLLVGHVMFASVAMVCAVAQIWPGLRRRHPVLHRRVGRVYVFTAIPAAVCAMVIGAATPFGPILAVSNVLLASLWLWFTINGYLAGRDRRFAAHRHTHGPQRNACAVHHHEPNLDTDPVHRAAPVAGQRVSR